MELGRGHLEHHLLPSRPVQRRTGGHLRLVLVRAPGAKLMVIWDLLLALPAQTAPCGGAPSSTHSCPWLMVLGGVLLVSNLVPVLGTHLGLPAAGLVVFSDSLLFREF